MRDSYKALFIITLIVLPFFVLYGGWYLVIGTLADAGNHQYDWIIVLIVKCVRFLVALLCIVCSIPLFIKVKENIRTNVNYTDYRFDVFKLCSLISLAIVFGIPWSVLLSVTHSSIGLLFFGGLTLVGIIGVLLWFYEYIQEVF